MEAMFQMDVGRQAAEAALQNVLEEETDPAARDYVTDVVQGAQRSLDMLDRVIEMRSENWSLDRLGRVDRTILRLALYEMLYRDDVPAAVAINEAVSLAKRYGSEKSGSFVNGVLDPMAAEQVWPGGSLQESNPD